MCGESIMASRFRLPAPDGIFHRLAQTPKLK